MFGWDGKQVFVMGGHYHKEKKVGRVEMMFESFDVFFDAKQ